MAAKAMDPKRIDLAQADSIADEFARKHNLPASDGIVRTFRRRLKMAFGLAAYRNGRDAEKRALQPDLFHQPPPNVIPFRDDARVAPVAPKSGEVIE